MKRDRVFSTNALRARDFVFDEQVAEVFDDMVGRSVPYYREQQEIIEGIVKKFWIAGTNVYDLGCSTATTLVNLGRHAEGPGAFVGYDNSPAMIEQGRRKIDQSGLDGRIDLRYGDLNGDLAELPLENASVVTMCWTLQFVRPLHRDNLIQWIHKGLRDGGALVVTEKVLAGNGCLNRLFIELYYDLKRRNGYSETEIARKREALENVLVPYSIDENREMFQRNGFETCETFFQWCNFAGFLAVKEPR